MSCGPRSPLNTDDLDDDDDDDAGVLATRLFASAGWLTEMKNIFSLISDGRKKETSSGYLAIVNDSIVSLLLCVSQGLACYC